MPPSPKKRQAKAALRQAGITKKRLAKTTGTTRKEVTQVFNATAKRMSTGKLTAKDTRAIRRALSGGPMAGVPHQPKVAAKKVQKARRIYKRKTS